MQLIWKYDLNLKGDIIPIDNGERFIVFANKNSFDYFVTNLYHPKSKLTTLNDEHSQVSHLFYALSKGQRNFLQPKQIKDYHIVPYRFSVLHILSHLKLAHNLQSVLAEGPLYMQDILGKSAVQTCI